MRVAREKLTSTDSAERRRALERLGQIATPVALEALAKALEPGGAARTSLERWTGVHALAAHAKASVARLALARALGTPADNPSDPIAALVSRTAALALAQAGDRDSLLLLGQALRQQGPAARAALEAILAHPPKNVTPLLEARGAPTVTLIEALGRSGDQRAFHTLRGYVRRGAPEIRAAAAVELTRLGGFETVALAKRWLQKDASGPLRDAALDILLRGGEPSAQSHVARDLAKPERRASALALAARAPSAELAPALIKLLDTKSHEAGELIAILGQTNADAAVTTIATALKAKKTRAEAALALARMPNPKAKQALSKALTAAGAERAWAVRASALREAALGDAPNGLQRAAKGLLASKQAADRAAGAWALAALDARHGLELLGSTDEAAVAAAARLSTRPPLSARACGRLAKETSTRLRVALAACLVDPNAAQRVPSSVLHGLVDSGGVAAPLAARALAARDDTALRKKIEELLESGSPIIRAHTILGLGFSRSASALGLAERGYYRESDARTRHAVVLSLAARGESVRARVLKRAATLDPDARVRGAARVALAAGGLSNWPSGAGTIWAQLTGVEGAPPAVRAVGVRAPTGLSIPLVSDPDGAVLAMGFPEGMVDFETSRAVLAPPDQSTQSGSVKGR